MDAGLVGRETELTLVSRQGEGDVAGGCDGQCVVVAVVDWSQGVQNLNWVVQVFDLKLR